MAHEHCNTLIQQQKNLIDQQAARIAQLEGLLDDYVQSELSVGGRDRQSVGRVRYMDDARMVELERDVP